MKIGLELSLEEYTNTKSRLVARVILEGDQAAGSVVVLSGPTKDLEDYMRGRIELKELQMRWGIIR
jgi:hypothetical protein